MTDVIPAAWPALPVVVACAACGGVEDLLFVLSSSFGLTALLALGQIALDRARQFLGFRRGRREGAGDCASYFCAVGERPDDRDLAGQLNDLDPRHQDAPAPR